MPREEVPGPGERDRRGLVAGEQQGDHLVAELPIGHRAALLVAPFEEHGEQVPPVARVSPVPIDESSHDPVEPPHAAHEADVPGKRDPIGDQHRPYEAGGDLLHDPRERLIHLAHLLLHVHVEERLGRDAQGEGHHLLMGVARLSIAPVARCALRVLHHRPGVVGEPVRVEGGRGEASLAQPEVPLAREQAVAEEETDLVPEEAVLDEVARLFHQHLFDMLGTGDEQRGPPGEVEAHQVAVLPGAGREELERAGPQIAEAAEDRLPSRTGRAGGSGESQHGVGSGTWRVVGARRRTPGRPQPPSGRRFSASDPQRCTGPTRGGRVCARPGSERFGSP